MKVIVIGAGVIGASIAFRLAEAGAAVTVLDAGRVGGGTSSCSYSWTNSHGGRVPIEYHALRVASQALYPELKQRFGDAPWFHPVGNLEWMPEAQAGALEENVRRLQERGHAVEWITKERLLALEPGVNPASVQGAAIAWYPGDGWVDPVDYAGDLIRGAQDQGATVRLFTRVAGIAASGGRVTGARLEDGTVLEADIVVNSTGRWAREVADEPGLQIPLAPTIGLLAFTPPVACCTRRPLHPPGVNLRPDGAGRVMVQAEQLDATLTLDATISPAMPQVMEGMRRAEGVLPGLRGVTAEAVRMAVRPIPQDGLPAIGPVPRVEGYYLAVTHSGVTLSPIVGQLVAEEIVRGRERAELATFRPGRFFN